MFFINKFRNILLFLILILLINFLFVNKTYAYNTKPGELKITEIMTDMSNRWIEVINKSKHQIDISGYSITTGEQFYLYPTDNKHPFIIPKDYIIIFVSNISKLQSRITEDMPVVMIEIPDLSINPISGAVVIRDQLGVEIDKIVYKQDSNIFSEGYSLERISIPSLSDKLFPSIELGGTPGKVFNFTTNTEEVNTNQALSMTSPYVDKINDSQINIYWTTSNKANSIVEYGIDPNALDKIIEDNLLTLFHVTKLRNLQPNTIYYYKIISRIGDREVKSNITRQFKTGINSSYRPSIINNIKPKYDMFDAKFLDIIIPSQNLSKGKITNNLNEDIDSIKDPIRPESNNISGYSIATILAFIFIAFIVIKFYIRNKKQYNFDFH